MQQAMSLFVLYLSSQGTNSDEKHYSRTEDRGPPSCGHDPELGYPLKNYPLQTIHGCRSSAVCAPTAAAFETP